jgi:hypothetical protein
MIDEPNWADVLSAVGTCLIGLAALSISILTYRVESAKLRRERLPEQKKILRDFEKMSMLLAGFHSKNEEKYKFDLGEIIRKVDDMSIDSISLFGYNTSSKISDLSHEISILFREWNMKYSKSLMSVNSQDSNNPYSNMWEFFISDKQKYGDMIGQLFAISDSMRSVIDPNPKTIRLWNKRIQVVSRMNRDLKSIREYLRNSA